MLKRTSLTLALLSALVATGACAEAARGATRAPLPLLAHRARASAAVSDRDQDGLAGPVRRVKTETAKITVKNGKPVEGSRAVLETTTYDQKGTRVDNAYFLEAGGTITGKEVYKYDERGNIVEMTLHNADGTLLSKETYAYEFDAVGNWVKMTTSVAIIEGGKVTFEPSEVTYRTISYYLDEATMAKMSGQPSSQTPSQTAAQASAQPKPAATNAVAQQQQVAAAQPKPSPVSPSSSAGAQQQGAGRQAEKPAQTKAAPVVLASLDKSLTAVPSAAVPVSNSAAESGGPVVKSEAEAPAAPVRTGPLKPISGGILNGKAVSLPAPVYPEMAKKARSFGLVEVEVVIDITGKVISAKAVKGPALLQQSAEQAAKLARFTPTLLSGQPVRITGVITYNFTLN
jgi:protein TonB